jgi:FkbM family methyltransferase
MQEVVSSLAAAFGIGGLAVGVAGVSRARNLARRLRRLDRFSKHSDAQAARIRRRAYIDAAEGALQRAGRAARGPIDFPSEFGEDALLWDLFEGKLDGFFIEAGAYDGRTLSVSYAFEQVGWRGLLVEAIPARFDQCRSARQHSHVAHAALGPAGAAGVTTFTIADGQGLDVLSYRTTGAGHDAEIAKRGGRLRRVEVPVTSLDVLLRDHRGGVDFASIDVEGGELDVLHGFDLDRFMPRVLLIEDASAGKDRRVPEHLSSRGYVSAGWIGFNLVFIRADDHGLLVRARSLLAESPMFSGD